MSHNPRSHAPGDRRPLPRGCALRGALVGCVLLSLVACDRSAALEHERVRSQWREASGEQKLGLAREMVRLRPDDAASRLGLAQTLLSLDEPAQAIEAIDGVAFDDPTRHARALDLRVQAWLIVAGRHIDELNEDPEASLDQPIEDALQAAEDNRLQLASLPDQGQSALVWQAGIVAAEHRWQTRRQDDHRERAYQARRVNRNTIAQEHEQRVAALEERLTLLDRRLRRLTNELILADPRGSVGYRIQFEACVRRGDMAGARDVCAGLIRADKPDPELVFDLAYRLIRRDDLRVIEGTTPSLQLAQRMLEAVPEGAGPELDECRARAWYALRRRAFDRAQRHARAMLDAAPQHPDALGILGLIKAHHGQAYEAGQMLGLLVQRERSGDSYELLGDAHTAVGDHRQAREAYRRALDAEAGRFTARLKLVRSLAEQRLIEQAAWDLDALNQVNPRHPLVRRYTTYYDVATVDRQALVERLDRVFAQAPVRWADAAGVAAMVLGDEPLVAELERLPTEQRFTPGFADVVRGWTLADPAARAGTAIVVAQALTPRVNDQPLRELTPPPVRSMQRWVDGQVGVNSDPGLLGRTAHPLRAPGRPDLFVSYYVPWPEDVALELCRLAQLRWPGQPVWHALRARLAYWLGDTDAATRHFKTLEQAAASRLGQATIALIAARDLPVALGVNARWLTASGTPAEQAERSTLLDLAELRSAAAANDMAAVRLALRLLLRDRPDAMLGPLWLAHHFHAAGDTQRLADYLAYLEEHHTAAALLVRGRVAWLKGDTTRARSMARMLNSHEADRWHLRRLAADIAIGAALDDQAYDPAIRSLESVALRRADGTRLDEHTLLDVLIEAGRHNVVRYLLNEAPLRASITPHERDAMLARGDAVLNTPELRAATRAFASVWPGDPLLDVWAAQAHIRMGELAEARAKLEAVRQDHPDASRATFKLAEVYARLGMEQDALALLDGLTQRHPGQQPALEQLRQRWLPAAQANRQTAGGGS